MSDLSLLIVEDTIGSFPKESSVNSALLGGGGLLSTLAGAASAYAGSTEAANRLREAGFNEAEIREELGNPLMAAGKGALKGLGGFAVGSGAGALGAVGAAAASDDVTIDSVTDLISGDAGQSLESLTKNISPYASAGGGLGGLAASYMAYKNERDRTKRLIDRENLRRELLANKA